MPTYPPQIRYNTVPQGEYKKYLPYGSLRLLIISGGPHQPTFISIRKHCQKGSELGLICSSEPRR